MSNKEAGGKKQLAASTNLIAAPLLYFNQNQVMYLF